MTSERVCVRMKCVVDDGKWQEPSARKIASLTVYTTLAEQSNHDELSFFQKAQGSAYEPQF